MKCAYCNSNETQKRLEFRNGFMTAICKDCDKINVISKEIVDDIIDRFIIRAKESKELKKEGWHPENWVKRISESGYLDEQLYTIRKYASKEQMLRVKKELGRDFRKFFSKDWDKRPMLFEFKRK